LATWFGTGAVAAAECLPYCDYNHYYGPFDFTYVQPGLFGYPLCGPRGNCSPQLVYSTTGFRRGRITVLFPRLTAVRPSAAALIRRRRLPPAEKGRGYFAV